MWIISLLIVLLGDTKYPVETALYIVAMAVGIIFKDRLFWWMGLTLVYIIYRKVN